MNHAPFYGKTIDREKEQQHINSVLSKYRLEKATDELKKKVYEDLLALKHRGEITIPFQVKLVSDPYSRYPPYIEILLDSKV